MRRPEIDARVTEALRLVRLDGYERRRSHELSGGQMQRVALARALVNRPAVLLLDEPLSALDLKIRLEMEVELRRVHRETGATFVYVTHDQREALALSRPDRRLRRGPDRSDRHARRDLQRPGLAFAARFVGDANVLPVEVTVSAGGASMLLIAGASVEVTKPGEPGPAWLVLRPEVVRLAATSDGVLHGTVRDLAFRGTGFTYRVEVPGVVDLIKAEMSADGSVPFEVGSRVALRFDPRACSLLPRETG